MKSINFKWETLKKILCLFIILINFPITIDNLVNTKYVKPSKIDNFQIIGNSNSNATRIEVLTHHNIEVIWGNNVTFLVNFTYTIDNGTTWTPVLDPNAYCNLTIWRGSTNLIKTNMTPFGNGVFFKEFNSSRLSTEIVYIVIITGFCPKFPDPDPVAIAIIINAVPTKISAHDYSTLEELPEKTYTAYYNELINITIKYCINESGTPLNKAHLTYQWLGLAPIDIFEDPVNKGFFTFTINTSDAQTTFREDISITASYENYTTQSIFVSLAILERKTTLNNQTNLLVIHSEIFVQEQKLFIFTYRDANTNEIIGNLSEATYIWEEYDANQTVIGGGTGDLIQNINKTYTLDFNTELRQVGDYFLIVTLMKENYEYKNAIIGLEIKLRPTLINGTVSELSIFKAIEFGTALNFTFEINNTLTHSRIGDLDHAFYYWYRTDSNGTIVEGPSQNTDLIKDLNDLYILDFNTELRSAGFYRIHFEFHKENYSSRYALINLEIMPKPTLINGTTSILYIIEAIEFGTAYNFIFEINDTHSRIGDLDHAFYYWYRTDSNGTIVEGPSQNIDLIKDLNDLYILDFNTELRSIGFYRIYVEFHKENYSSRYAIIIFTIYPPLKNPSQNIIGFDLTILLGVIIIITLAIKKKIFNQGLKKR